MSEAIKNRYDFVILFDVENGNPNGDPDADNMPRIDPLTQRGLITDVCLKRKIRDYVDTVKEGEEGYRIYIKKFFSLNKNDEEGCESVGILKKDLKKLKSAEKDKAILNYMCNTFYDIRAFGAVMTTFAGMNSGQVRGPVQLTFAQSVEPVTAMDVGLTRVAQATESDLENKGTMTMGRKYVVPYGLYRCEGFVSANLARKTTGFSEEDLALLWQAIINMFELDRSAARGKMAVRELIVFKHDSEFGNAPAHKLFDLVKVTRKDDSGLPARAYTDYEVSVNEAALPAGVTCTRMI